MRGGLAWRGLLRRMYDHGQAYPLCEIRLDDMTTLSVIHNPEYCSFYIFNRSRSFFENVGLVGDQCSASGFGLASSGIMIRILSEYSDIPITIEYQPDESLLASENLDRWDHVVECPLTVTCGEIYFESSTDPLPFATVAANNGKHRVRIYWGGQYTGQPDGSSEDFYLIQIWPDENEWVKYVKGTEEWPIPIQPHMQEIIGQYGKPVE